jgi:Ca-activated chloride channel family protein
MDMQMNFNDFNFAQPVWLCGLLLIPIGWAWYKYWQNLSKSNLSGLNKFIDEKLLPHLLIKSKTDSKIVSYGWLYGVLTACIVIALANPRWSYEDLDAYQTNASMVILLDLSASMNATDITPSRIIRARQSIEDLLNLSKGLKIGLVGFAGNAHLISPVTDDLATVKTYIPALDTDLTKLQGNSFHQALLLGGELLANEPGDQKSILVVSDGNFASTDFSKELAALHSRGVNVHVLGVGTATGAPYKNHSGALHKSQGKLVISKLNTAVLQTIAKQGHGIYTETVHNDAGIKAILHKAEHNNPDEQIISGKVRQWQDRYYWFIFPAAIILLYLMRQRVLYVYIAFIMTGLLQSPNAMALDLSTAFKNSEQQGQRAYIEAEFQQAAELFNNPYRKGIALYRAGEFAQAEQQFNQASSNGIKIDAQYNAGNAQMQQRKWRAAIKSYETVLKIDPDHFAAQHNLEIAKRMQEEQPENEDEQDQNGDKQDKQDKQDNQDSKQDQKNDQQQKQDPDKNKQDQQEDQNKQDQQNQQDKQDQQSKQDKQDQQNQQQDKQDQQQDKQDVAMNNAEKMDEAQAQQWLNRIDSDIKVFLKNKFYIEDVISAQ